MTSFAPRAHRARALAAGLGALFLLVACVARERNEVAAAREAHAACVAERGADHPDCEVLRHRVREVERRYEENARRAWGCDPRTDECPVDR